MTDLPILDRPIERLSTEADCVRICRDETILAVYRAFARWVALDVAHLWKCPDVVRQYLETGDGGLMDEAHELANVVLTSDGYAQFKAANSAYKASDKSISGHWLAYSASKSAIDALERTAWDKEEASIWFFQRWAAKWHWAPYWREAVAMKSAHDEAVRRFNAKLSEMMRAARS